MIKPTPTRPGLFSRFREGLRVGGAAEKPGKSFRFPLHAYGKLPIYKDFIATGLTEPGPREFRAWLDRGFSHRWSVDEDYRSTTIPRHNFLLRLPESKTCVAGSMWGSSDEGGLRKFPFALFVSFAPGHPAAEPLAALEYLPTLEARGREIRDGSGAAGSLASFYAKYRGAEVDCSVKPRERLLLEAKEELGAFGLPDLAESVMGSETRDLWPGFMTEVERAASGLERGAGVLRLPIGAGISPARQLKLWILWLERTVPKRRNSLLGLLYTNDTGRAALFFREIQSEDILLLHPTKEPAGVLDPLADARSAAIPSAEAGESVAQGRPATEVSSDLGPSASAPAFPTTEAVLPTSGTQAAEPETAQGAIPENAGAFLLTASEEPPSSTSPSATIASGASPGASPSVPSESEESPSGVSPVEVLPATTSPSAPSASDASPAASPLASEPEESPSEVPPVEVTPSTTPPSAPSASEASPAAPPPAASAPEESPSVEVTPPTLPSAPSAPEDSLQVFASEAPVPLPGVSELPPTVTGKGSDGIRSENAESPANAPAEPTGRPGTESG